MIIFSNGCSFLTDRPKDGVMTHTGKIIAQHLQASNVNLAMGGRGNDRISFTTKLWFAQNSTKDVFAIIGWSSSHRHDYITNDGWKKGRIPGMESTWRTWKSVDNLRFINSQRGWDIDQQGEARYLDHVVDLQNFFKVNKIPYVMYNSLPNPIVSKNKDFNTFKSMIDTNRFFSIESSQYDQVMTDKDIVSPDDPHPSKTGHEKWAKQLMEFIDANNLRTL